MALSETEVGRLAVGAGITDTGRVRWAIAYAMAASGGRPDAVSSVPSIINSEWDSRIGIWQIRSKKAEQGKGSTRDRNKLLDPASNARAMAEITAGGTNWAELDGDLSVAARARLIYASPTTAAGARNATGKGDALDGVLGGDPGNPLGNIAAEIAKEPLAVLKWLQNPATWKRIVWGVAGVALIIVGIGKPLLGNVPVVSAAKKAVGK